MKTKTPEALAWAPYTLTNIDQPRTGFVGRAAAMRINGVECIVLCKNDEALAMVGATLTDNSFNPEMVYKATLIHSTGIEVEAIAVPVDEPGTVVAEADGTPVREDGAVIVEYASTPGGVDYADGRPCEGAMSTTVDDDEL